MKIYCVEKTDGYEGYGCVNFTTREAAEEYKAIEDNKVNAGGMFYENVIHEYEVYDSYVSYTKHQHKTFNTKEK
jgi:hypothetical protein